MFEAMIFNLARVITKNDEGITLAEINLYGKHGPDILLKAGGRSGAIHSKAGGC